MQRRKWIGFESLLVRCMLGLELCMVNVGLGILIISNEVVCFF
jgi:hypothetical protein